MQRRVRIAQVLLVTIAVLGALVVGRQIVTGSMFSRPYHVTLDLPGAAGLHAMSDVAYRGQHIGTVSSVHLTATGVRADLAIDHGVKIPTDSEMVVADLSAVGEQYVDVRPRTAAGPFLGDGAVVTQDAAALPLPTYTILADTTKLMAKINPKDIQTLSREAAAVFGGDADISDLAHELGRTLDIAEQLTPEVLQLLRDAKTPLTTLSDLTPQIRTFVTNARRLTAQLADAHPVLQQLLDQGAVLLPVIDSQFTSAAPKLVNLLRDGTPVAVMAKNHLPGLQHWYQYGPLQLTAMAAGTRDGSGHVVLVVRVPKNCHYRPDVSPFDTNAQPDLNARCTTVSSTMQQRGSQYVPHQ
jgi:phospholipid/cholesterol/gamma-HCH transport system substrate-binding protein